ncbi:MAG TPA: EF-hand domain-containing protein [Sphingomicrobium sp.]|nr:EF-hand domain-containing protein [Sphingomicrobium sp.]
MTKLLISAAALALVGTAALAQPTPPAPPGAPMAHHMGGKTMTRAETVAMVREHFGRLDNDKDGVITKAEIDARHSSMSQRWQNNGIGHAMTIKRGDPNAAFDRLDSNKDGMISRDEFAKAREERIEKRVVINRQGDAKDGAGAGKRAMRMHRMHRMGGMGGGRMIVMADVDKDGRITLAEAEAMALQHFDQMDSNRDGQVTPEERRAGRPMIIKRMIEQKKAG